MRGSPALAPPQDHEREQDRRREAQHGGLGKDARRRRGAQGDAGAEGEPPAERAREQVEDRRGAGPQQVVVVDARGDEVEERLERHRQRAHRPRPGPGGQQLAQEQEAEEDGCHSEQHRLQAHQVEPVQQRSTRPHPVGDRLGQVVQRWVVGGRLGVALAHPGQVLRLDRLQLGGLGRAPQRGLIGTADEVVDAHRPQRRVQLRGEAATGAVDGEPAGLRHVLRVGDVLVLVGDLEGRDQQHPDQPVHECDRRHGARRPGEPPPRRQGARARARQPRAAG